MFNDSVTKKTASFLTEIGIKVESGIITEETILPGILIDGAKLIVDETKFLYPGDFLHEAGHLDVKSASERQKFKINIGNDPAEEMMAIAWSYAPTVYSKIPSLNFSEMPKPEKPAVPEYVQQLAEKYITPIYNKLETVRISS